MANMKIQFSRLETALKNDRGHNFTLLYLSYLYCPVLENCRLKKPGFCWKMLGFRSRTHRKDRKIVAFFGMERNWNCVACRPFSPDLFHWVRLLTIQRKGKFMSRRSDFYFSDRVLSIFYDSSLANYVASLDFLLFPMKYVLLDFFVSDL